MKTIILMFFMTGCWGYQEVNNQMVGQVKKYHHNNPILCPNYDTVDVSLGIMKNGVGSMSTQDLRLTVWNENDAALLEKAAQDGSIVDIKYSVWRQTFCREEKVVQYAKVVK